MNDQPYLRPEIGDFVTIFLVSATVMLYQITLTRVLSVVVWYHFAFLTISMVMLGLGVPGVWFALVKRPLRHLPGLLLASGISVPLSIAVMVKLGTLMLEASIISIIACILPATLSLGGVVCLILIKARGRDITAVYGVDLLGAGLAAVLVIPLMHVAPTPQLAAASGLLPLACLLLFGGRWRLAAAVAVSALTVLLVHGSAFRVTHSKSYDETVVTPIYEKWSPTARITIFDESFFYLAEHDSGFSWGRGTRFPSSPKIRQYWLEQDGSAGSPITHFQGDLSELDHLMYDVTTVGYQLRPTRAVAIIGAGGGRDILSALRSGATEIHAVELNTTIIDAVSNHFAELSGDVYHLPGVTAIASEGRSYLTHTAERFDLIQISLIDSWAASVAGAFALAENNLYTVEAFKLYQNRLNERGLISTSRWLSEMPRLIVLAHSALAVIGVDDPSRHLAIVAGGHVGTLLTSAVPFGNEELERLAGICEHRGFALLYPVPPGARAPYPFIAAVVNDKLQSMAHLGLNIEPPTDDSPYFFHLVSPFTDVEELGGEVFSITGLPVNLKSTVVLRQAMIAVTLLAISLFILPFLARISPGQRTETTSHLVRGTCYFAAIGWAFMLLENMLVQRFVLYLGHPSYATTVIIASLLVGMGLGSMNAEIFGVRRLQRAGFLVPAALAIFILGLPPLFSASLGFPLPLRIAVATTTLAPVGAVLGVFFPLGMMHFGDRSKPWFWAINGAFGVTASVMSLALSMEYGFTAVGFVAVAGYMLAWTCLIGNPHRHIS